MYKYKIFGFLVASEIDIGQPQVDFEHQDVLINYIPRTCYVADEPSPHSTLKFVLSDVVEYYVKNGDEIDVVYHKDDKQLIKLYLLGSVFYLLMLQNKIFALHGSAVAVKEKCFVFTGPSGAGKSSLARGFIKKGYKILSDDVSRMKIALGKVVIVPSYPSQKLWEDAISSLDAQQEVDYPVHNEINKFYMNVDSSFNGYEAELAGVVMISVDERIDQPVLNKIEGPLALKYLLENTYRISFIKEIGLQNELLELLASVYNQVIFYELRRPAGLFSVDNQVTEFIENVVGA